MYWDFEKVFAEFMERALPLLQLLLLEEESYTRVSQMDAFCGLKRIQNIAKHILGIFLLANSCSNPAPRSWKFLHKI